MRRIDVDDAGLADELQSEIDGDRRERPNSSVDLRLNEGDRNRALPGFEEHVSVESRVASGPFHDLRLIEAKAACDPADQGRNLEPQSGRSLRQPIRHRFHPVAVPLEAPVVLADQGGEAGREQVERHLPSHAPRLLGKLRDERGDAVSTKAEEARKDGAAGEQRMRAMWSLRRPCPSAREARGSIARSARILTTELRSRPTLSAASPAMAAKTGQHFIRAVGGRGEADLVEKDAGEIIPGEEFAKPPQPPSRAQPDCLGTRSGTSLPLRLLFSAQPPQPRLRSPRQFTTRSESSMPSIVGKGAVPKHSVVDRTARTAELPEDFRRFSKADNEEIEVDGLLHAAHGFKHSERIERVARGMGRRELRDKFPRTDHEPKYSLFGPRRARSALGRTPSDERRWANVPIAPQSGRRSSGSAGKERSGTRRTYELPARLCDRPDLR